MFDITSTLKKFFKPEKNLVEPSCHLSSKSNHLQDSLSQAPRIDDVYSTVSFIQLHSRSSSCHHPYYFFEQEQNKQIPSYLTQEASFQETTHPNSQQMLEILGSKVEGEGLCKQSLTGLVYLDISSDYLLDLAPFFSSSGGTLPQLQAHIAIISPDEAVKGGICLEEEIDSSFPFSITECDEIVLDSWKGVEKVWILKVYSEELEALRKKFGLCPRMQGKDFHILVSLKPSSKTALRQDFFRVSPTILGV